MKSFQVIFVFYLIIQLSLITDVQSAVRTVKQSDSASWGSLRHKLNQILDSESKEVGILQNLLMESETSNPSLLYQNDSPSVSSDENDRQFKDSDSIKFSENKDGLKKSNPSKADISALRELGIITKLEDNSKRMDSMMVFLADLRNVLSEAITTQSKQMTFEGQVVELREEIEYLRKEIQVLKKDQALNSLNQSPSIENKLQNDETTINWLKDSTKELRNQINEMSRSCNASALLQMEQKLEQQSQRQQSDLLVVQKQIETIQVQQLRQDEQISEAKGNIVDVRSWQANMGQKFIDSQTTFSDNQRQSNEVTDNEIVAEEHFLTEAFKESSKIHIPTRHGKKLKARLREMNRNAKQLAQDHYHFNKRLVKIEDSQTGLKGIVTNMKKLFNFNTKSSLSNGKSSELFTRLSGVENTISEYTLTLQSLGEKVNGLNELQESTLELFKALEALETRYDEKLTDMQTSMAKMEASVSSITNSNEDIKEQQIYQSGQLQGVKKDIMSTKGKLQTNHLRLASIQSQLLKLSSQKCSIENSESIQNIRLSALESLLQSKGPSIVLNET